MSESTGTFLNKLRHEQFHNRLAELIADFPELAGRMEREFARDPVGGRWDCDYEEEGPFDPKEPMYLDGFVVVMSFRNVAGWTDITYTAPHGQSPVLTTGLLHHALDLV